MKLSLSPDGCRPIKIGAHVFSNVTIVGAYRISGYSQTGSIGDAYNSNGGSGSIGCSKNAHAAQVTRTIQSVNTKSDSLTLSDGRVYMLPEGIEAEAVRVGDEVDITFTAIKGRNRASPLVKSK